MERVGGASTEQDTAERQGYHDFSDLVETSICEDSVQTAPGVDRNFPVKLHYMLSELERDGLDHIASWQPHGRCFLVHKQKEFTQCILPL